MANYPLSQTGAEVQALLNKIDDLDVATTSKDGLLSSTDKAKLNGIESGAEENVIEEIVVGGNALTPSGKSVTIPVDSAPASGSNNPVSSGAVYTGLGNKQDTINDLSDIRSGAAAGATAVQPAAIADFITRSVDDLVNYYLKSETYTKSEVQALIAAINQFHYEVYASLEAVTSPANNVLYLIGPTGSGSDKYEEYVWPNATARFVKIGDTSIDLSGYVTTTALNTALANYTTTTALNALLAAKSDKPSSAVEGNLAKFNGSKNPVDSGIPADNVALKDGYYQTLVAGAAERLVQPKDISGAFFSRTSGGDAEISNGNAQFKGVEGWSVKVNQLVQNGNFSNGTTGWGGYALSEEPDGTVSSTANNAGSASCYQAINIVVGHKYYLKCIAKAQQSVMGTFESLSVQIDTEFKSFSQIFTARSTSFYVNLYVYEKPEFAGKKVYYKNYVFIDLTALGIDNLTTVAQVEEWLAENWGAQPYYDYNPGEVVNVNMKGIESIGRNLLDAETGKVQILGKYSDVYDSYYGIVGTHGAITFTDALGNTETITPDSDGKFLIETPGTLSVADAGSDCSVFFWWDGSKTDYSAPQESVARVDVTHIWGKKNGQGDLVRVWPTGMPGLGDLRDLLGIENGEVVARRKMQEVDLGTLDWTYTEHVQGGANAKSGFYTPKPSNLKNSNNATVAPNCICSKYVVKDSQGAYTGVNDNCVTYFSGYNTLYIVDSNAGSDAAAFKAALNGVKLYYELATEEVYTDLVYQGSEIFHDGTPVTLPVNYEVDNWGMENILPKNDSTIRTAKPTVTCKYSLDAVEMMDTMQTEIDNLDEGKADKEGDFPGIVAGSARTLTGDVPTGVEFTSQKTGQPNIVSDGIAVVKKYKGKTLVWNQLVNPTGDSMTLGEGVTVTKNSNGSYTLNGTATSTEYGQIQSAINVIINHKYLMSCYGCMMRCPSSHTASFGNNGTAAIVLCGYSEPVRVDIGVTNGTTYNNLVVWPQILDLTLMFGAGNEPTSVAEFEALYPGVYYAYNAGALKNNAAKALKTVGFNQWDEEWESGILDNNGVPQPSNNRWRAKNMIPAFPSATYYVKSQYAIYVYEYDANGNMVNYAGTLSNTVFTTTSQTSFIRFNAASLGGGAQYDASNAPICINLSNASKNGTYEPYQERVININLDEFDVRDSQGNVTTITGGLKSAGSVYDEISGGKYIKRIGSVDLGDLDWTYSSDRFRSQSLDGIMTSKMVDSDAIPNVICSKYATSTARHTYNNDIDKVIWAGRNGFHTIGVTTIIVIDSAYSDAAAFKTAMSGVILYYELAEPEIYDLVNKIPMTYQEWGHGTETRLPVDSADSILAPLAMDVVYPMDAVGTIQKMPQNYDTTASLDALASSIAATLSSALGGTFNITRGAYDETNQKYNWSSSFTPNS